MTMRLPRALSAAIVAAMVAVVTPAVTHAQPAAPQATEAAPTPADLLFDTPQFGAASPGTVLTYRYDRVTAGGPMEGVFGPAVADDRIRLTLEAGDKAEHRTVRVEMFNAPRRRGAGPFEDVPGNPVLVLFLEHHLEPLAKYFSANPRYIKNAIRAGLRDKAEVTPTSVAVNGRSVPGRRIAVRPFADDKNKERMRGLENLTYTVVTSDAVPGAIVSIEVKATGPDGNRLLEETLTHVPNAG